MVGALALVVLGVAPGDGSVSALPVAQVGRVVALSGSVSVRRGTAAAQPVARGGYVQEGDEFHDPRQGVRGRFLVAPDQPRIELLVNEGSEVLTPWLDAGVHVYHRAYEVPSVEAGIAELREVRARVVVPPVPAVAFDGRLIAFLMLRNRLLVELIGAHSP